MNFEWQFNVGNVVSILAIVFAIWKFRSKEHRENSQRLDNLLETLKDLDMKVSLMWNWFKREHHINGGQKE